MQGPLEYLKQFEQNLPKNRAELLKLWSLLAAPVLMADPERYSCIQQALEQELPFSVLVLYVFRESRRALEFINPRS